MQKSKSQSRLERQSQTIDHTLSIKEISIFCLKTMKDKTAAFKNVINVIHTVKLKYKLIGFKIITET
jgi:hypothetical protein